MCIQRASVARLLSWQQLLPLPLPLLIDCCPQGRQTDGWTHTKDMQIQLTAFVVPLWQPLKSREHSNLCPSPSHPRPLARSPTFNYELCQSSIKLLELWHKAIAMHIYLIIKYSSNNYSGQQQQLDRHIPQPKTSRPVAHQRGSRGGGARGGAFCWQLNKFHNCLFFPKQIRRTLKTSNAPTKYAPNNINIRCGAPPATNFNCFYRFLCFLFRGFPRSRCHKSSLKYLQRSRGIFTLSTYTVRQINL